MSSRTSTVPPALQVRSKRTQDRIFAAGTRLLQEGGAEGLTVASVAAEAGVAVGSVYRRFGDKERLLLSIHARCTEDFIAEFRERLADARLTPDTPAAEVIAGAVRAVAQTLQAHAPLLRVFLLLGAQNPALFDVGSTSAIEGGRIFREAVMLAAPALSHHPDVEVAIDFAHRLTFATCMHRVVHGEHLESARSLGWEQLTDQLCMAVIGYLLPPSWAKRDWFPAEQLAGDDTSRSAVN